MFVLLIGCFLAFKEAAKVTINDQITLQRRMVAFDQAVICGEIQHFIILSDNINGSNANKNKKDCHPIAFVYMFNKNNHHLQVKLELVSSIHLYCMQHKNKALGTQSKVEINIISCISYLNITYFY